MRKKVFLLCFLGLNVLFSSSLKEIDLLVDKINSSKNIKYKEKLLIRLNNKIETLNQRDYYEAQIIIHGNLKPLK